MSADSTIHDSDGEASVESIEPALALLVEALEMIDALDVSLDIGARLQEVINSLEEKVRS